MGEPFGAIFFFFFIVVARPLTTLLHELGHAIPLLLVSKGDVTVFVGSFGEKKNTIRIKLGRLTLFLKYNVFLWLRGLCVPSEKEISINHQILYTLMGPLVSLLISLSSVYAIYLTKPNVNGLTLLFAITISALIDFLWNIYPSKDRIKLDNGTEIGNDGAQLKNLFAFRKLNSILENAGEKYQNKEYKDAFELYRKSLSLHPDNKQCYRLVISCLVQLKDGVNAKIFENEFIEKYEQSEPTSVDLLHSGLIDSYLGNHLEAMNKYNASLHLDDQNLYALCNRGFALNQLERYEEALEDFNKALTIEPEFVYILSNRGLSKIKLGDEDSGLDDISKSLEIERNNPYAYRSLGIYHLDRGEEKLARKNFLKSKELDPKTENIDSLIEAVQIKNENA